MVFSLAEHGSLAHFLKTHTLSWTQLCVMLQNISQGVSHLHSDASRRKMEHRPSVCHRLAFFCIWRSSNTPWPKSSIQTIIYFTAIDNSFNFRFQGHKYKQYSGPLWPILQPERLQVQPEDQRPELLHCFGRERVGLLCREQLIVRGGNGAVHGPGVAGRRPQPAGLWVRSQAGRCLRHGADLLGSRETVQRFVSGMIYHWKKFTFVIFKCFYSFGQILNLSFVFHDSGNRSPRFLLGVPNWAGPPSEIANFRGDENLSRPQQGPSPLPLRVEGLQPGSATSQGNHRVLLGPRRRGQTDFAVRRGADPGVVDSLGSISK